MTENTQAGLLGTEASLRVKQAVAITGNRLRDQPIEVLVRGLGLAIEELVVAIEDLREAIGYEDAPEDPAPEEEPVEEPVEEPTEEEEINE